MRTATLSMIIFAAVGCGGRVERAGAEEGADASVDAANPSDAALEVTAAAPPYDLSPARCLVGGNHAYTQFVGFDGRVKEYDLEATLSWMPRSLATTDIGYSVVLESVPYRNLTVRFDTMAIHEPLKVARYTDTVPGYELGRVRLSVTDPDRYGGCGGEFEIHQLDWETVPRWTAPELRRFLITFQQNCKDFTLRGCMFVERPPMTEG